MAETKIMVLKRRNIFLICAATLVLLVLILILCFIGRDKNQPSSAAPSYTAGIYHKEMLLGDYPVSLTVTASDTHITGASITYQTDAVEIMYPLLPNALLHINEELAKGLEPNEITPADELRYTETYLIDAILDAVSTNEPSK